MLSKFIQSRSSAFPFTKNRSRRLLPFSDFCLLTSVFCLLSSVTGCTPKAPDAVTKPPDNYAQVVPVFGASLISLQVGDDGNAGTLLPQLTQLAPQEPAGWANLGLFRLRQGNFDAAREALTKAQGIAPKNGPIEALLGLLESRQGHFAEAVTHLKASVALAPDDLRVRYALVGTIRQQGGAGADAETQTQLDALTQAAPDNLFVLFEAAIQSAKSVDAGKVRAALTRMAAQSNRWPADAQAPFKEIEAKASGPNLGALVGPLTGLRHLLEAWPDYQQQKARIQPPPGSVGEPLDRFLVLPPPAPTPAPPDMKLTYAPQPALDKNDSDFLKMQRRLAALGGAPVNSPAFCAADFNNDSLADLCLADRGGLRLLEQGKSGLADVTKRAKLPAAIVGAAYSGAWAADLDGDGDLDLLLGTANGSPRVLRNNYDGTWAPISPFGAIISGVRDFAWGDMDGDGVADAAIVDGQGRLFVFENRRSGHFEAWTLPPGFEKIAAVSTADVEHKGQISLVVLREDGGMVRLSRKGEGWESAELARANSAILTGGQVRLFWADLDNNGSPDLIVAGGKSAQIFLSDAQGAMQPLPALLDGKILSLDDTAADGRIALIGESGGKPTRWTATGSVNYHWQRIQLKAAAVGDNRNNSFGIGGEIELRAGLLYTKIPISGPILHFGLGDHPKADYIRILWPNGSPQGEFSLAPDQIVNAPERLKGSCPWLFADDGQGMKFVTDLIWRSPLGLRLNAQVTAGVAQTRDWVKIRGDQLKPRAGFYNLNVTAELWETHFFDLLELRTVDHPAGTEALVDERFVIPPPPLAVNLMTPPQPIYRAVDDRGQDVTAIVRAKDGQYLDTFGRGAYQGVTRDHYVELDFGPNLPKNGKTWLVAYGWVHPTDSSINVAISQGNHAPPRDLSLEIPDGKGGWKVVRPHLGFPEGKNKTVLIDVTGLFPAGVPARARLRTNLEIYWDFIGVAGGLPPNQIRMKTVPLRSADLRYRGFSVTHQPNLSSPEVPEYTVERTAPRWLDLSGFYTRFGDVRELLTAADDRYVIMNAGDEMRLQFPAQPPPPVGWVRDYVLVGDGWVKDGDFNTGFSKTVLPLPAHDRPNYNAPLTRLQDDPVYKRHSSDWQTYQTRYVAPDAFRSAVSGR